MGDVVPLRVLLADDNEADRELAYEAVAEFAPDFAFTTVGTRAALFNALEIGALPHVLLLDLHLGLDLGSEIAEQLRSHAAKEVPLVILSSAEDEVERARCLATGAVDFWLKPLCYADYGELLQRVRVLSLRRQAVETQNPVIDAFGLKRGPLPSGVAAAAEQASQKRQHEED